MIETIEELVNLVNLANEASEARLRSDTIHERVWEAVFREYPELKRVLVFNATIDASGLRLLAKDADSSIRVAVANRRRLPTELFELLARDDNESVRARIAWNKKTPLELLRLLAGDKSKFVADPANNRLKESRKGVRSEWH